MSRTVAAIINTGNTKPSADAFSCSIDEIARPTADAIPTADMYLRSVALDIGISSVASSVSRPSSDPFRSPLAFFFGHSKGQHNNGNNNSQRARNDREPVIQPFGNNTNI